MLYTKMAKQVDNFARALRRTTTTKAPVFCKSNACEATKRKGHQVKLIEIENLVQFLLTSTIT